MSVSESGYAQWGHETAAGPQTHRVAAVKPVWEGKGPGALQSTGSSSAGLITEQQAASTSSLEWTGLSGWLWAHSAPSPWPPISAAEDPPK